MSSVAVEEGAHEPEHPCIPGASAAVIAFEVRSCGAMSGRAMPRISGWACTGRAPRRRGDRAAGPVRSEARVSILLSRRRGSVSYPTGMLLLDGVNCAVIRTARDPTLGSGRSTVCHPHASAERLDNDSASRSESGQKRFELVRPPLAINTRNRGSWRAPRTARVLLELAAQADRDIPAQRVRDRTKVSRWLDGFARSSPARPREPVLERSARRW